MRLGAPLRFSCRRDENERAWIEESQNPTQQSWTNRIADLVHSGEWRPRAVLGSQRPALFGIWVVFQLTGIVENHRRTLCFAKFRPPG